MRGTSRFLVGSCRFAGPTLAFRAHSTASISLAPWHHFWACGGLPGTFRDFVSPNGSAPPGQLVPSPNDMVRIIKSLHMAYVDSRLLWKRVL